MNTITKEDVINEVRKLAAERPDFIYTQQGQVWDNYSTCSYVSAKLGETYGEGCIVGQALQRLGVSKDRLDNLEGNGASSVLADLEILPVGDKGTLSWLDRVQLKQDLGLSWGESIVRVDAGE